MASESSTATAPELSVILPAYEEAKNLRWLLPELKAGLSRLNILAEVLVVDAESRRDDTAEVCATAGVMHIPRKGGALYSNALKTGIAASRGAWVLCMDADGSHDPGFFPQMWQARFKADVVIASRYVKGGNTENPFLLIFLSYMVNAVFRAVLGIKCRDLSNSYRLYKGDSLRSLELECKNFDIIEEILLKLSLRKPDLSILEIPFTFKTRREGHTKRDLVAFGVGYLGTLRRLHQLKRAERGIHP